MRHAARRAGLRVGRDQVGRLMRVAGAQGVRRGAPHEDLEPRQALVAAARPGHTWLKTPNRRMPRAGRCVRCL